MNNPLAMVLGQAGPVICLERIEAALRAGDQEGAVAAIWQAGVQIMDGEADLALAQLTAWVKALPAEGRNDTRIRYLVAWSFMEENRNTLALLLLEELALEWAPALAGPHAQEATGWLFLIRLGQAVAADAQGMWEQSRTALQAAFRYAPPGTTAGAPTGVLEGSVAEQQALADPFGFAALVMPVFALFRTLGHKGAMGRAAHLLGAHYLRRGQPATARYWLEQALDLKRGLPGRLPLVHTLLALGSCHQQLGQLEDATGLFDEALRLATDMESPTMQAAALSGLGDVHRDREEFPTAVELYRRALALRDRLRDGAGMAETHLSLSTLHRRMGHAGLAADAAAEARTLGIGLGSESFGLAADLHESTAAALLGDEDAARRLAAVAGRLTELQIPDGEALANWYLAMALARAGDVPAAEAALRTALAVGARYRSLHLLAMELPVTAGVCGGAAGRRLPPEALAGIIQRTSPRGLTALLDEVPEAHALVAAAGRLPETAALQVRLLGPFRVARAGGEVDLSAGRSQKAVSLFKFLVAQRGKLSAREQILDALWPEADPESADRSFEVTLSTLRRLLDPPGGTSLIIRRGRGYMINPELPLELDVNRFSAYLERGNWWWRRGQAGLALAEWEQAEAVYGGDFLADDPYEDWATADRERLREQYLDLLLRLGEASLREGRCAEAAERAYRVIAIDPIREAAYRLLMRAHAGQGNRAVALRDLERCSAVLHQELGAEPMAETRELGRRIRSGEF